jgi:hypothetical protein
LFGEKGFERQIEFSADLFGKALREWGSAGDRRDAIPSARDGEVVPQPGSTSAFESAQLAAVEGLWVMERPHDNAPVSQAAGFGEHGENGFTPENEKKPRSFWERGWRT